MSTTKKFWTWDELNTKVRTDQDLQEKTFISDTEMVGYANEAIDHCETLVNTLYKDYFLAGPYEFPLVSGTDEYAMPPRIYADAIRRAMHVDGSNVYTMHRVRDWHKFEIHTYDRVNNNSNLYSYFLSNDDPGEVKFLVTPVPTTTPTVRVWYIRQANRFVLGTDGCAIVYATCTCAPITFTAVEPGVIGNDISLVFDGVDDVDTVVNAWNAANPTNTVGFTGGPGATVITPAQTISLENGGSDILDIPEAHNYVMQFMKIEAMFKESGGVPTPRIELAQTKLKGYQDQLEGTLAARTPDAENEIELDYTHYQEHT